MKNRKSLMIVSTVIIALIYITVFASGAIGVSKSKIEQDARQSQKINKAWLVAKDVTNDIGVLLFYDKELDKHAFSVYLNKDGFSYGYFFREGGTLGYIDSGIQGLSYQDKGMALLSMNNKKVAKIQMDNGQSVETIIIDPLEPFAIIIPSNIGEVALYNSNGEEISIDNILIDNR